VGATDIDVQPTTRLAFCLFRLEDLPRSLDSRKMQGREERGDVLPALALLSSPSTQDRQADLAFLVKVRVDATSAIGPGVEVGFGRVKGEGFGVEVKVDDVPREGNDEDREREREGGIGHRVGKMEGVWQE
jgi:hypothetical protein